MGARSIAVRRDVDFFLMQSRLLKAAFLVVAPLQPVNCFASLGSLAAGNSDGNAVNAPTTYPAKAESRQRAFNNTEEELLSVFERELPPGVLAVSDDSSPSKYRALPQSAEGQVYVCEYSNGKQVAVKVAANYKGDHEYSIMQQLQGVPGVPRVYDRILIDNWKGCIRMEMIKGEDMATAEGALKLDCLRRCAKSVLTTLQGMHERGIVHGDIKPDNIVSTKDKKVQKFYVIDFGGSFPIKRVKEPTLSFTIAYAAPEVILSPTTGELNEKIDIFALGASLFSLAFDTMPRNDKYSDSDVLLQQVREENWTKIVKEEITYKQGTDSPFEDASAFENFLLRMLVVDPKKRASAAELLNDPFIKGEAGQTGTNTSNVVTTTLDQTGTTIPAVDELTVQVTNQVFTKNGSLLTPMKPLQTSTKPFQTPTTKVGGYTKNTRSEKPVQPTNRVGRSTENMSNEVSGPSESKKSCEANGVLSRIFKGTNSLEKHRRTYPSKKKADTLATSLKPTNYLRKPSASTNSALH